jgi:hypothetical protein
VQDDSSETINDRKIVGQVFVVREKNTASSVMLLCMREEPEVQEYCPEHPEEIGDHTNGVGAFTDITVKGHGRTENPLTIVGVQRSGGKEIQTGRTL